MSFVLFVAGFYNLIWGGVTVLFPNLLFDWVEIPRPNYPELWQCIGMIIAVFGVGYLVAGLNPLRHWPIVLVGFLGKIFGPIGFLDALYRGVFPIEFGVTILTNDLLWWIPFFLILRASYREYLRYNQELRYDEQSALAALEKVRGIQGKALIPLSSERPLLLFFLRHFGCTFCRELLGKLKKRNDLGRYQIVFVHMADHATAGRYLAAFPAAESISDPSQELYRKFGLTRGTPLQLFGPRVFLRGVIAGIFKGHLVGPLIGDGFQMPGTFLIKNGAIIDSFRPDAVCDEAELDGVLTCPLEVR